MRNIEEKFNQHDLYEIASDGVRVVFTHQVTMFLQMAEVDYQLELEE